MQCLGAVSKKTKMISVHFQGKPFNITVIQVCVPTNNAEEAEVEWFYEDLQDLLELAPKKEKIYFCFIDYAEVFDCVDHSRLCGSQHTVENS